MRSDNDGVAGFFEDLPVLVIILSGVCVLVLTSSRMSAEALSRSADDRLKDMADSIIDHIRSHVGQLDDVIGTPLLSSLTRVNVTECAEDATGGSRMYKVVITILHPDFGRVISSVGSDAVTADRLAVSSALLVAADESANSVVVEIRAMVW